MSKTGILICYRFMECFPDCAFSCKKQIQILFDQGSKPGLIKIHTENRPVGEYAAQSSFGALIAFVEDPCRRQSFAEYIRHRVTANGKPVPVVVISCEVS